ncbi:hypothetical protein [Curtobacterium flaccumfaciens]|uniref:hypothetical protein n=1 Tax=Curtobacterium flaccumfaciens TaxID=2035 RepID=UPI003CF6529E
MDDPVARENYIKYRLSSLRDLNEHHTFESICTDLARHRIIRNIRPASGPVSAKGDQGKDAESYWTELHEGLSAQSGLADRTSAPVALACSTQTDNIKGKVRHDVATILQHDAAARRVVFFSTGSIPAGWRHELEKWAARTHQIVLDLWDLHAIAKELADPDLFPYAAAYLHIPETFAPAIIEDNEDLQDYRSTRAGWHTHSGIGGTLAELIEVRRQTRLASTLPGLGADLPFWLEKLDAVAAANGTPRFAALAGYEHVWAHVRRDGTVRGSEDHLRLVLDGGVTADVASIDLIGNAVTCLQLGYGAWMRSLSNMTKDELDDRTNKLRNRLGALLADGQDLGAGQQAELLQNRMLLDLQQRYPDNFTHDDGHPLVAEFGKPVRSQVPALPAEMANSDHYFDAENAVDCLRQIITLLPGHPLIPIDDLVSFTDFFGNLLDCIPGGVAASRALDPFIVDREGNEAAAHRRLTRARRLDEAGETLAALAEWHRAAIDLYHASRSDGLSWTLLQIAGSYSSLGLPMAAKQYALAAAAMAGTESHHDLRMITEAVNLAAQYEHQAGLSGSFMNSVRQAVLTHQHFALTAGRAAEAHPDFANTVTDVALLYRLTVDVRPTLIEYFNDRLERAGLDEAVQLAIKQVADQPSNDEASMAQSVDGDQVGRPYSDFGPERRYEWHALGRLWCVRAANRKSDVLAAERFIAMLQITQSAIAELDPVIAPGTTRLQITATDERGASSEPHIRHEHEQRWLLAAVPKRTSAGMDGDTFEVVLHAIADASLLAADEAHALLDAAAANGLMERLFAGRPYEELADMHDDNVYDALRRRPERRLSEHVDVRPPTSPQLPYPTGRSPRASAFIADAKAAAQSRYDTLPSTLRWTLEDLRSTPDFQRTLDALRTEGWKDWHFLLSITNLLLTHRAQYRGLLPWNLEAHLRSDPHAAAQVLLQLAREPEEPTDFRHPPTVYTTEELKRGLLMGFISGLGTYGLTPPHDGLNEELLRFVDERYGYFDVDVPHPDPFAVGFS